MKARLLRKAGTSSCAGSLTTSSSVQRLEDGSTPFLSEYEATQEQFAPWNMRIIAMRCGERTYQTATQHSKLGGGTRTLTLSLPPISWRALHPQRYVN